MGVIETIRIVSKEAPDGFCVINKCDKKKGDEIYKGKSETTAESKTKKKANKE